MAHWAAHVFVEISGSVICFHSGGKKKTHELGEQTSLL
jgi:hypothetical protein